MGGHGAPALMWFRSSTVARRLLLRRQARRHPLQRQHHLQHQFQDTATPSALWHLMTGVKPIVMLAFVRQISADVIRNRCLFDFSFLRSTPCTSFHPGGCKESIQYWWRSLSVTRHPTSRSVRLARHSSSRDEK